MSSSVVRARAGTARPVALTTNGGVNPTAPAAASAAIQSATPHAAVFVDPTLRVAAKTDFNTAPSEAVGSGQPRPPRVQVARELRYSVGDGAAYGVMVGIGETYFPPFVLAIGLGEVFAGLIASVPLVIGGVLQLISPYAVRWLGSHRRWVLFCAGTQACCFLPMIGGALAGQMSAAAILFVASIYWGTCLATGPAWNTWQGTLIPPTIRARFFARRTRIAQATTLAGFLAAGAMLQYGKLHQLAATVFAILFGIAAICRFVSLYCLWQQSEPVPIPSNMQSPSLWRQCRQLAGQNTGRLLLFAAAMQTAVYIAGPYFVPFMLKNLGMSYVEYVMLIGVSFVAKFTSLPWWGSIAQRFGAFRLLWCSAIGVVPLAVGWSISQNYWWLMGLQVAAGMGWAAYELAVFLLFFDTIPESDRTSVLTIYNLLNNLALALGSLIGALILQWFDVTTFGYLLAFAMSTVGRGLSLILLRSVKDSSTAHVDVAIQPLMLMPNMGSLDEPEISRHTSAASEVSGAAISSSAVVDGAPVDGAEAVEAAGGTTGPSHRPPAISVAG